MLDGEDMVRGKIAEKYAPEFEMGRRLLQFSQNMLPEGSIKYESGELVVSAVLALVAMGMKVYRGIHHLAANCLTEPALMLLRPLSEVLASLGYIVVDPAQRAKRAELYLAGEVIEYYKWAKELIQEKAAAHLPAEIAKNPEGLLEPVRQRLVEEETSLGGFAGAADRAEVRLRDMIKRPGWAEVSTEEMFQEAQAKLAYPLVFKMGAGILHARRPGMFATIDDEGTILANFGVTDINLGLALGVSNLVFAAILGAVNQVFSLGLDKSINDFMRDLEMAAKKRKASGDAPRAPDS